MKVASFVSLSVLLASCNSTPARDLRSYEGPHVPPFSPAYTPPSTLETPRVRLEPLAPEYTEIDHAAFTSSVDHLRHSLQWGSWPSADYPLEQNRADLERHWNEFQNHEAYAYTVLVPDGSRCVGCVYMNPTEGDGFGTTIYYWVVESELQGNLDGFLVEALLGWIQESWPLDSVTFPIHPNNTRGRQISRELGLEQVEGTGESVHQRFVWRR